MLLSVNGEKTKKIQIAGIDQNMTKVDIQEEVESLLVAHFPRDFWVRALDDLHAAYGMAYDTMTVRLQLHKHELLRALPQARHYKLSSTMRSIAESSGLEVLDLKADNSGENYVVLRSGPLQLGRIGVNQGSSLPRGAKHRALIAALNARLEGVTHDLFSPTVHMIPSSTLGLLLVNVNPKQNLDQDRMIDLQVGVPYSDLSGWHYLQPCSKVLTKYSDLPAVEEPMVLTDKAVIRLKEVISEIEALESRDKS